MTLRASPSNHFPLAMNALDLQLHMSLAHVCMYVCMHVCLYVCMNVCMVVCLHTCLYVCMYVLISVCMSVCMYFSIQPPQHEREAQEREARRKEAQERAIAEAKERLVPFFDWSIGLSWYANVASRLAGGAASTDYQDSRADQRRTGPSIAQGGACVWIRS
jgi:hypothetical protein